MFSFDHWPDWGSYSQNVLFEMGACASEQGDVGRNLRTHTDDEHFFAVEEGGGVHVRHNSTLTR